MYKIIYVYLFYRDWINFYIFNKYRDLDYHTCFALKYSLLPDLKNRKSMRHYKLVENILKENKGFKTKQNDN